MKAELEALAAIPTATIYEAAGKSGDMSPAVRPILAGQRMAGQAFTVRTLPCQSLPVLRAIAAAPPGSVLVIDAGASDRSTIWGGTSSLAARVRGLAGVVTNASVRDIDELVELGFPVFAAGVSLRGTLKDHPGETGVPVSVGGVPVMPGDLVFGDGDGVVVVPLARAIEVATAAAEQRAREESRDARIRDGEDLLAVLNLS
ncbi:MAG: RraA family protein [Paracoccaceae bacterium]